MTAVDLLGVVLINALWCVGFYRSTDADMLLGFVSRMTRRWLPYELQKPLHVCLPCMASLHGLVGYIPAMYVWNLPVLGYLGYIVLLAGVNALFEALLNP